jgi:glycosyltransferase involved in cell wall biosynthesis
MPLVSVVIATKNRPVLLERAVRSVLLQSVADLEIIVVLDRDEPDTMAMLSTLCDERVRVYFNPEPAGPGVARNAGAGQARGEWIAFLDDDDEWLPAKLERQLALPRPPNGLVILSCLSAYVTPYGTSVRPRAPYWHDMPFDEWLFDRKQLFGGHSFIQTSSFLMPTTLFREIGFARGQHEDWELAIVAINQMGVELLTAPEMLVRYYAEEDRFSQTASERVSHSLRWADSMRHLMTKRAYSGFCLTVVAHRARHKGGWREFATLIKSAFRDGRPTAMQLLVFVLVWTLPPPFHLWLRRLRPGVEIKADHPIVPAARSSTRQYV